MGLKRDEETRFEIYVLLRVSEKDNEEYL